MGSEIKPTNYLRSFRFLINSNTFKNKKIKLQLKALQAPTSLIMQEDPLSVFLGWERCHLNCASTEGWKDKPNNALLPLPKLRVWLQLLIPPCYYHVWNQTAATTLATGSTNKHLPSYSLQYESIKTIITGRLLCLFIPKGKSCCCLGFFSISPATPESDSQTIWKLNKPAALSLHNCLKKENKGVASNMVIYPYSKRWHLCPGLNILLYCLAPGLCHLFCQANIGWLLPEVCLAFTDNHREQSAYNLSLSFFENCKSLNHSCHFFLFTAQI